MIKPQLAIARLRLHASELSICLSVCLSVCRQNAINAIFFQKLSNLELWCLLTTYRKLCKLNWTFQRTHYWIPTIQDGWDMPSWKSIWRHFFYRGWSDLDKVSQTGTEWHVDCGDLWKWKPFTVTIPEPHATLQGVRIPSAILKIVFRHILFYFCF